MVVALTVGAAVCCAAVVWCALAGRVPAATGWTLGAAIIATTVVSVLADDAPSRFAATVLALGCMAESGWTITASAVHRRRTARALAR